MFPENLSEREKHIEAQVIAGNFSAKWTELVIAVNGVEVKLNVMDDALKIDGIRANASATLCQRLADMFDASLPTAMVADMMFVKSSRRATPCPMPISTSVSSMVTHSQNVDRQIRPGDGIASTVGKHWILDKQLESAKDKACNYGWHFMGPNPTFQGVKGYTPGSVMICGPNVKVIQPNATAHDRHHSDYSQICQLVSQQCWVDGVEMRFSDLVKDSRLAHVVSHQGPLQIDRQPGVDPVVGQVVLFPVQITADNIT